VIVIGFAMAWAGYTIGIWGYCLVQGYDVTLPALFKTTWPGGKQQAAPPGPTVPGTDPTTGITNT